MVSRLRDQASWLLSRAHLRAHGVLQEAFAAAGSRPYHYRILAVLEEFGPLSQAELGRRAGIDPSDVTTSLDALGSLGFAAREADPLDRRRKRIRLTDAGRDELLRLDAVLGAVQKRFLAPLNSAEQAEFLRLIARLSDEPGPSRP